MPVPEETRSSRYCRTGICNTDIKFLKGYMGFKVVGHEFVGIVKEIGKDTKILKVK